jgi:hypothetical protein
LAAKWEKYKADRVKKGLPPTMDHTYQPSGKPRGRPRGPNYQSPDVKAAEKEKRSVGRPGKAKGRGRPKKIKNDDSE